MASLAAYADVAFITGATYTSDEQTRIAGLLDMVSGLVRVEANRTFDKTENTTVTLRGSGNDTLRLPNPPVRAVDSVTVNGTAVSSDAYTVNRRAGTLVRYCGVWGDLDDEISVTYDHGFDPAVAMDDAVLDAIRGFVAGKVAERLSMSPGVRQEQLGAYSVTYMGGTGTLELTDDDRRQLRRILGRPGVTSVQVGTAAASAVPDSIIWE